MIATTERGCLDLLRTHSDHRLLPPERLDPLLRDVYDVIEQFGGTLTTRYEAHLYVAHKKE